MDILEQIRANYGSFSRPRQRISDFILNYPEQCCFLSLRSFAQQVGTTEVTVLNFCRGLGLGSYMDLKKALQDYLIVRVNAGDRLKLAVAGQGLSCRAAAVPRICTSGSAAPSGRPSRAPWTATPWSCCWPSPKPCAGPGVFSSPPMTSAVFPPDTWSTGCSHWS